MHWIFFSVLQLNNYCFQNFNHSLLMDVWNTFFQIFLILRPFYKYSEYISAPFGWDINHRILTTAQQTQREVIDHAKSSLQESIFCIFSIFPGVKESNRDKNAGSMLSGYSCNCHRWFQIVCHIFQGQLCYFSSFSTSGKKIHIGPIWTSSCASSF